RQSAHLLQRRDAVLVRCHSSITIRQIRVLSLRPRGAAGVIHEIACDPSHKPDPPRPAPLERVIPGSHYTAIQWALPIEAADPASITSSAFGSPFDYGLILIPGSCR